MSNAVTTHRGSNRCGSRRMGRLAMIAVVSIGVGIGAAAMPSADAASTPSKAKPRRATRQTTVVTLAPTTVAPTTAAPTTTAPTTLAPTTVAPSTTVPGKSVTFSIDIPLAPGSSIQVPICTADSLSCAAASYGPAPREVSGSLIGQLVQTLSSVAANGKAITTGFFNYSGAVEGCSVGQFSARLTIEASATATFSGIGSTFPWTVSKWEVVPGTGSRGLPSITGGGTMTLTLPGPTAARQTYTGRLVCAPLAP